MKKLIFLLPFIIYSCTKKESVSNSSQFPPPNNDSAENLTPVLQDSAQRGIIVMVDSTKNSAVKPFRVVEGNKIIQTLNGDMLPVNLTEKFNSNESQLLLKIKNFKGKNISALISPENQEMNIRFNQIKLPNGTESGPFGRALEMPIPQEGELWLVIGKNNMASGEAAGKFRINIK